MEDSFLLKKSDGLFFYRKKILLIKHINNEVDLFYKLNILIFWVKIKTYGLFFKKIIRNELFLLLQS